MRKIDGVDNYDIDKMCMLCKKDKEHFRNNKKI